MSGRGVAAVGCVHFGHVSMCQLFMFPVPVITADSSVHSRPSLPRARYGRRVVADWSEPIPYFINFRREKKRGVGERKDIVTHGPFPNNIHDVRSPV